MSYRTLRHLAGLHMLMLMFSAGHLFGQGLYWETSTTVPMAGEMKLETKSYYLPRMFKQTSDKAATIFRLDKQMLYTVDYEKKEYSEMTFAELEAFVKAANSKLDEQMAELKKQLANMPAQQREAMEKMMGAKSGSDTGETKIEVVKMSESKTISGYPCAGYTLKQDGKDMGNVWTTTHVPDFNSMRKDFKEFSQRLASQMSMIGSQMAEAMRNVDGFAIQTTISGMTATVTKVTKSSVAQGEFEIPSGFKKVKAEDMMGKRRRGRTNPPDEGEKQ